MTWVDILAILAAKPAAASDSVVRAAGAFPLWKRSRGNYSRGPPPDVLGMRVIACVTCALIMFARHTHMHTHTQPSQPAELAEQRTGVCSGNLALWRSR